MENEEEKDMAVAADDIKRKLADLKRRAELRKSATPNKLSIDYIEELGENAKLICKSQFDAIDRE